MTHLAIDLIRQDGGTQPRAAVKDDIVAEYRADMMAGATFPPVTVFFDGSAYWLADGFHRIDAAKQLGQTDIAADVHQGTRRDAILYSVGANAAHGVRRTNEDKRRAVMVLLNDSEWALWPVPKIASTCGVSERMVWNIKQDNPHLLHNAVDTKVVERNGSTYTMNTANIGHNGSQAPAPAEPLTPAEQAALAKHEAVIEQYLQTVPEQVASIGENLLAIQKQLSPAVFGAWLQTETPWGEQGPAIAARYMQYTWQIKAGSSPNVNELLDLLCDSVIGGAIGA